MENVILRAGRAEDVSALSKLFFRSWLTHWGPHVDLAARTRFLEERPAEHYAQHFAEAFVVAERAGIVVGVYHLEGDFLHAIHVAVSAIGSGVGKRLMGDAEAKGARRLEVREFNEQAYAFYTRRGWIETGRKADTEMGFPCTSILMQRF